MTEGRRDGGREGRRVDEGEGGKVDERRAMETDGGSGWWMEGEGGEKGKEGIYLGCD